MSCVLNAARLFRFGPSVDQIKAVDAQYLLAIVVCTGPCDLILFALQVEKETLQVESGPWLQHCVLTLSPCLDLLVVARGQKAAFLSGQTYRCAIWYPNPAQCSVNGIKKARER